MGKKFKSDMQQWPLDVPKVGKEHGDHIGLSDKSKKIKKHKKDKSNKSPKGAVESKVLLTNKVKNAQKKTKKQISVVETPSETMFVMKTNKTEADLSELKNKVHNGKSKKTHKKDKQSFNDAPQVNIEMPDSNAGLRKSKQKKRKRSEAETGGKPKEEQSNTRVETNETDSKKVNVVIPEVHSAKPHKKKKSKKNINGTAANSPKKVKQSETETEPKLKSIAADKDVVTSESDSEAEQKDSSNPSDLTVKKEKRFTGPEHSIFIGNLPNTVKKSTMKAIFKPYGNILSIRFRSNDGVVLFKKKDRKEAKALNCYIRFETKQEAEAACAANGQLVEGNRIRVTMHTQKQMGHVASTVFVGNINHKTTDNELYDFFSCVGEIEYVRQIADKGIGYVCFKKGVSIAKALKLNQQLLNGRPLRIVKADPNKQKQRKNKKGNIVDKATFPRKAGMSSQRAVQNDRQLAEQKPVKSEREYHGSIAKTNRDNKYRLKKKKGGSEKKKKLLAQKLKAAGTSRK